jgi:NAD(P)-dependent dehydrogenase (short-subunit alcohol dehydrogenase family)
MASNNSNKIVLVTGANQGLGLAVIEVAGKRYPSNTYILCTRDIESPRFLSENYPQSSD